MPLYQDRDEHDLSQPTVSISLGLPAVFLFGSLRRDEPALRVPLEHGAVVAWGGPSRLRYHGVLPLAEGCHPLTGTRRFDVPMYRLTIETGAPNCE